MPLKDLRGAQFFKQIENLLRIADIGQFRRLEIGLERAEDLVRIVIKIENKSAWFRFARIGAIQAGERLHALDAAEGFIHVHRAQFRLVKTGLEFIGDQHDLIIIAVEGFAHIPPFQAGVHVYFSKFLV